MEATQLVITTTFITNSQNGRRSKNQRRTHLAQLVLKRQMVWSTTISPHHLMMSHTEESPDRIHILALYFFPSFLSISFR